MDLARLTFIILTNNYIEYIQATLIYIFLISYILEVPSKVEIKGVTQ